MRYDGPSVKPHDIGVAVAIIVVLDGKILLLKRKGSTGEGTWAIPGGAVEFGEGPETAVLRELREETGLEAEASGLEFIGYSNDRHAETPLHYVTLRFLTTRFHGKPTNAEPHKASDIGWFPIDELPEPMFSFTKSILEKPDVIKKISSTKTQNR